MYATDTPNSTISILLDNRHKIEFDAASVIFTSRQVDIDSILITSICAPRSQLAHYLMNWDGLPMFSASGDGLQPRQVILDWASGRLVGRSELPLLLSSGSPQFRLTARCMDFRTDVWVVQLNIEF